MMKKRILLAEDHVEMRKIIGLVVSEEDFELFEASDGLQTLELARQLKPDLVLLDLGMPGLDGVEVCRRLRADPEMLGTRIIAVTGRAGSTDRALALQAGVDDYVTKPFGPAGLLRCVRSLLRGCTSAGSPPRRPTRLEMGHGTHGSL